MPDPASARTPWLRLSVVVGLLTFSGVTLASNVIPARDDVRDTRRMLERQQDENERTRERIEVLREQERRLNEEPWDVRRAVREQYKRLDEREIRVR